MSRRLLALLVATTLAAGVAAVAPGAAAGPRPTPDKDPFYRYSGAVPLAQHAPGTVLKHRTVRVWLGPKATPVPAEQLLYRTTDQLKRPTVTVTTVLHPKRVSVVPRIVEYLSFYDGLAPKCSPSFTLAGGNAGGAAQSEAQEEELLMSYYLDSGSIVTVPDFEGTTLHWMAAHQSGYAALDAIRATTSYLGLRPHTQVGLSGYSGGALAAEWASELAPAYAPEVNIVGVAAGGVPVNYAHMFSYANGSKTFSAAIPGMLLGLARAYDLDLNAYLSPYGQQVVAQVATQCMPDVFGAFPGLTYQQLMKPAYRDVLHVAPFARILAEQTMGSAPGHPETAIFFGNGKSDARGDGVMSVADVRALARAYCAQGVHVTVQVYRGAGHQAAGAFFEPQTQPFLQSQFNHAPAPDTCD